MLARVIAALGAGHCVIVSLDTLEALEGAGVEIRSAYNRRRVGTKDTYVVWTIGAPDDLEFTPNLTALASGRYLSEIAN